MQLRWLETHYVYNDYRKYFFPSKITYELQHKVGKEWKRIPAERVTKFI